MMDIKEIRRHPEIFQKTADSKGIKISIRELLNWDEKRGTLLRETEALREQRNGISRKISLLVKERRNEEAETAKEDGGKIRETLALRETELEEAERNFQRLMLLVPNRVSEDTPDGVSDADNVPIRTVGSLPCFDFEALDHVALGERLDIFDIPRGVKVAGARNYFLKGMGVHLHRGVQQLAVDLLTERGFSLLDVPLAVRGETLTHTGFFPLGEDQAYGLEAEDKYLIGTSEVPLISYYGGEIVDVEEPIRMAAVSACFRREVGSAGRDVRGLYRVHQFAKVEQVVICGNDPSLSERILQEMTRNAEDLLDLLELPYQVVAVCSGDQSQKTYKQYDIETWMPSRNAYGETHSASSLLDFQARRSNIRYRDANGRLQYCHTLNNTMVATPRILIPLLENHQREDGSVYIPKALRKYIYGMEELRPLD